MIFDLARPKYQSLKLKCLICDCRFRQRVIHWRQFRAPGLAKARLAQVRAIRCPSCQSDRIDSDLD